MVAISGNHLHLLDEPGKLPPFQTREFRYNFIVPYRSLVQCCLVLQQHIHQRDDQLYVVGPSALFIPPLLECCRVGMAVMRASASKEVTMAILVNIVRSSHRHFLKVKRPFRPAIAQANTTNFFVNLTYRTLDKRCQGIPQSRIMRRLAFGDCC